MVMCTVLTVRERGGNFMAAKRGKNSAHSRNDRSVSSIWNELLYDIRFGRYKDADKLPPETELAAKLGISRTQLRDGLAILEQSGFITRRRRIGTVINRHVTEVSTRIDLEVEFLDMIAQAGYIPGTIHLEVKTITDNEKVASSCRYRYIPRSLRREGRHGGRTTGNILCNTYHTNALKTTISHRKI